MSVRFIQNILKVCRRISVSFWGLYVKKWVEHCLHTITIVKSIVNIKDLPTLKKIV